MPIPRRILLTLVLAGLGACASSPRSSAYAPDDADRDAILRTIDQAFLAITAGSREQWEAVLTEAGSFSYIAGEPGSRQTGHLSFAEHLGRQQTPPQTYLESYWDPIILVDGDLAMVWAPYDFSIDGAFSHAGIDAFTLLRTDAGWRISGIAWSVEPEPRR